MRNTKSSFIIQEFRNFLTILRTIKMWKFAEEEKKVLCIYIYIYVLVSSGSVIVSLHQDSTPVIDSGAGSLWNLINFYMKNCNRSWEWYSGRVFCFTYLKDSISYYYYLTWFGSYFSFVNVNGFLAGNAQTVGFFFSMRYVILPNIFVRSLTVIDANITKLFLIRVDGDCIEYKWFKYSARVFLIGILIISYHFRKLILSSIIRISMIYIKNNNEQKHRSLCWHTFNTKQHNSTNYQEKCFSVLQGSRSYNNKAYHCIASHRTLFLSFSKPSHFMVLKIVKELRNS